MAKICIDQLKTPIRQLKRTIDQFIGIFNQLCHTFEMHVRKDKAAT